MPVPTVAARLPGSGDGMEAPHFLTALCIQGKDISSPFPVCHSERYTENNLVPGNHWTPVQAKRRAIGVAFLLALIGCNDRVIPDELPGLGLQRHYMTVSRWH